MSVHVVSEMAVLMRREAAPGGGLRRACNAAFYRGLAVISALPLEPDASDFFLVGRPVIDVLQREIRERTRFLRGLVQWVGFRRAVLSYTAAPRRSGRSKYHLGRLFSLARDATLAFSTAPLRVAFVAAIAMLLACLATAVYSLGGWWLGNPPSGYTTIMLFSTAVAAAQFGLLGILGEYIGQLVDEAKAIAAARAEVDVVSGELTYGLERLAMYVQGVDNVYDLKFTKEGLTYGEVFLENERQQSEANFHGYDVDGLKRRFEDMVGEVQRLLDMRGPQDQPLVLPAYDQVLKASHLFNLMDARGAIAVAERQSYIGRIRDLTKMCAEAWVANEGRNAPAEGV
jgi:hypothetical protein